MRDFNFFSPYITVEKASKGKERIIAAVVCTFAAVVIGFSINNMMKVKKLETEISQMEAFITAPATVAQLKEVNDKKAKLIVMEQYLNVVKHLNGQIEDIDQIDSFLLEQIALSFPQDVFIEMMSVSESDIQMQGISANRTAVAELEYNLKNLDVFETVHVNMIAKEDSETENQVYTLKCKLK